MRSIIIFLAALAVPVHSICHYPSGRASTDVPCNDNDEESACCGPGMVYLSNRVCMASGNDLQSPHVKSTYVRGTCTDKTWRSGNCPSFCINPEVDDFDHGMSIERCEGYDNRFYCINGDNPNCRTRENVLVLGESRRELDFDVNGFYDVDAKHINNQLRQRFDNFGVKRKTRPLETQPVDSQSKERDATTGLSHETTIGIAIGLGSGGGLALLAAVVYYVMRRRHRRTAIKLADPPSHEHGPSDHGCAMTQWNDGIPRELQGDETRTRELLGDVKLMSHELKGDGKIMCHEVRGGPKTIRYELEAR
ncbi:hypothetical protein FALBO_13740 [Fusarium albosuccineum]|uniref:Uncharacterized protein n=1 Tax=Fusarium albosuccineum TaxID=1237068 RepID=A0A8H4KZD6_9HYPO|nr:hypothetical protein FALBO_13740 [Fusarium albosuccineum]